MLFNQKWKCSWSLAAAVASILALVSVVHLFLFPLAPSFDYFRQAQNSCVPVNGSFQAPTDHVREGLQPAADLDHRFPAGLHNEVVYHGAPWKAEIGRWLSGCNSIIKEVSIVEMIGGSNCKNDCSGLGICNRELGQCRCFHGYSGEGCSERLQLDCNFPQSPEQPYGRWVVSICPAYCDTTRAMCFCGEGTKYPNRPVAEACGFKVKLPSEPGAPMLTDWTKADLDNVFTTNGSIRGWCNVDPAEAYASKVQFKEECDCKYDCLSGRFCEVPVLCTCINQCSGHGHCRGGFCQCNNGWYGSDCSIPSVESSVREWPQWLRPAQINVSDNAHLTGKVANLNAMVKKRRPLIYVYDLPPGFNSLLLEGRHFKFECVNRIYDDKNATLWTDQLYGAQMALYESMLASPYRTLNGEEADFFFVPVLDSCIITRADDAPHLSMQEHMGLRSSLTLEFYKKAYDHIVEQYPYWNRSSGKDHIWFFSWDEGACYAPKEIWNSMMLVHWGNTNSKHNHSTTAYWADNWDGIPSTRRGSHPCFDPDKDLVLPAWKRPDIIALSSKLWARSREKRKKALFYFNGNLGPAYPKGRPEASYSMGIRQKIAEEFGSSPNKEGKLGKQHAEDVIVTPLRSANYHEDLASSVFCGVFPGDGWSGRMEDSILQGCIPVVIQDGIFLPYENVLNYESFAVRIREDEIPNLMKILRGFNETEIEYKLANVRKIWQRFLYRDSIVLEADRQKTAFGHVEDWAVEFLRLIEDDVFATFVQVLHYKLHNDPWRRHVHLEKEFGLPRECLIGTN
ncbi:putative glucuronoxylan glucuronosyltransferase f8h [Fagus crenata]